MITQVRSLFYKDDVKAHIQQNLPNQFYIAEKECARGDKVGMQVGCVREQQLISMLMFFLPKGNVDPSVPITEPEIDVRVSTKPLAIRTFKNIKTVKASWKVDPKQAADFISSYEPKADLLLVHVQWGLFKNAISELFGGCPSIYHVPIEVCVDVHSKLGEEYLVPPKPDTDARGVQYSVEAMRTLLNHPLTASMEIDWIRPNYKHDPYYRWFKMWGAGFTHGKYLYYK